MFRILLFSTAAALLLFTHCKQNTGTPTHRPSHAGESLRLWAMARTFPDGQFYTEKYTRALQQVKLEAQLRGNRNNDWEPLGPKNIGGRTLCLAVHPLDTNIMWAGAASGGIWKTTTAGIGAEAWQYVETGFPVLGVSAIAIDPLNPEVMYVGTGEVYNYENSMPNVAIRTTRGTYGIGILKSTDGGVSWTKSLDWSYGSLRGVQDIKINPLRPATVYAATTEGLLRSYDAGENWTTVHNKKMAVDIEINPVDTGTVFVTHGSLDDNAVSGIYRTLNGGASFAKLAGGLPSAFSGKTLLCMAPGAPTTLVASVGNAFAQEGLYRSTNNGSNWTKLSSQDVCTYQGWYSHDISIKPDNHDVLIWTGIDTYKSTNGGVNFQKKTNWFAWYFGQVPAGGPEGPANYVHADIHRVYFQTNYPDKVYSVTDGGIFVSYDAGESWHGRNGGYQSQQFYANLGNSATNPDLCIGGMQDNATAIYTGSSDWTRVLGGDGECTAIHPQDDQIMYGSSQYLNMYRSTDGGASWQGISPPDAGAEVQAFNGPFELAPSDGYIMYAGASSLFRSDDGGDNWYNASAGPLVPGDVILSISVHPGDPNDVWCTTAPLGNNAPQVFRVNTATATVAPITGLPNRLCMDIAQHPQFSNTVYAVMSGFNTQHVWRTIDGGDTWEAIDNGLPDIPTNAVLIDPLYPDHIYVGNDVGVWLSRNGGDTWELYSTGAPAGLLAMHLSISADRKLRVATYGLGVWQTPMAEPSGTAGQASATPSLRVWPNPFVSTLQAEFVLPSAATVGFRVIDLSGKTVLTQASKWCAAGRNVEKLPTEGIAKGTYALVMESKKAGNAKPVQTVRFLVKQ